MSKALINQYYSEVDKLIRYGGSRKETSIRIAFQNLLNEYAKNKDLILVAELDYKTDKGTTVYPDGTLKDAMRLDLGYWESKDEADDIEEEIKKKFAKGYPKSNILFEDSQTAILIQQGQEIMQKANKDLGEIYIDEITTLKGVPPIAWEYKLGNRSALEWILDQYKESKPSDPTIAEKFDTYCFADYKAQVIDLLQKVCTVSVRTMQIVEEMQKL